MPKFGKTRRIHPVLVLAALSLLVLFCAAGIWQYQRAQYKQGLQAATARAAQEPPLRLAGKPGQPQQLDFRRIQTRGKWLPERTVLLDNKLSDGVVGYHAVTPLQVEGSDAIVLVNRGWIAAPRLRAELPRIATPDGLVEVSGIARRPTGRFLELGAQVAEGRVWQNLTVERFEQWSGLRLLPVILYQDNPDSDGLRRVAPAPEAAGLGPDHHRAYSLMWFSLAGLVLAISFTTIYRTLRTHE